MSSDLRKQHDRWQHLAIEANKRIEELEEEIVANKLRFAVALDAERTIIDMLKRTNEAERQLHRKTRDRMMYFRQQLCRVHAIIDVPFI